MSRFSPEQFILPIRGRWKEMYIDTIAWSELARGNRSPVKLDQWLLRNAGFLSIAPHAAVELCRKPDLVGRLVDFMAPRKTVLLTHGKDEITGRQIFWASWYDLWYPVDIRDEVAREVFIEEMQEGSTFDVAHTTEEYREWLKTWLHESLLDAQPPDKNPWKLFDLLLEKWIAARTNAAGQTFVPEGLSDPDCYRGEKLQFGYIFERVYINRKTWSDSDFVALLHFREMAYAYAVFTEHILAHCIREIQRHIPDLGPRETYDLSWLNS